MNINPKFVMHRLVSCMFREGKFLQNSCQAKWFNPSETTSRLYSIGIRPTESAQLPYRPISWLRSRCTATGAIPITGPIRRIHDNITALQMKKRLVRKKRSDDDSHLLNGYFNVTAYATAEEYNLEGLMRGLESQNLYETKKFFSTDNLGAEQDVLYVSAKYQVGTEPRDIFFFREGSVILWNCNDLESSNVLSFLHDYETDRYRESLVQEESEIMSYTYDKENNQSSVRNGRFFLSVDDDNHLEKYTFSNALATSIKLGVWEATLDKYIESMEFITDDLKRGTKIRISRADLLRKIGELFGLRHLINLSSDCLDTPDFYWDREELETLYSQVCTYFSIARRARVMNEKLNHCVELAELVSSNLNDIHHVRLEWMIIILIMVEVGFEIIHYAERYFAHSEANETIEPVGIVNRDVNPANS